MDFYQYFQSHTNYFWQWEENSDVAAIPNGSTIAYRDFIIELLKGIEDQGLPSFGALLLFIIATNDTATSDLDFLKKKFRNETEWKDYTDDAFDFLQIVTSLPPKYKRGKNRIQLLQTLFFNAHRRTSVKNAKYIVSNFTSQSFGISKALQKEELNEKVIEADLRVLALLYKKMPSAKDILDRMASVPEIGEEVNLQNDAEKNIPNTKKDFVEELLDNGKTFHVGVLIKRIWSGLNIPYHNTLPSQQPIGGVSDLTNKGDFDRLLISEFANDDLVFLSRLANNEALYINREIPPQENDLDRIILIDVSLKNWGTPKIIAYALMLAIARHPKTDIHCTAFAVGNSMHALGFASVDDVIQSLYVLDDCLFPEKGLETFCKEYGSGKNMEVIFISSVNSVRSPVMQKLLADHHDLFNYWIYTDSEGKIDLYKKSHKSKKHVQHLELPLEKLWQQEKRPKPAIENYENYNGEIKYPILFPVSVYKRLLNTSSGKLFAITPDGKLLQHYLIGDYKKGWQLLHENINVSAKIEIGEVSNVDGDVILLMFDINKKEIILLNVNNGTEKKITFPEWKPSKYHDFLFYEGVFYYLEALEYRLIDPITGEMTLTQYAPTVALKNAYEQRSKELSKLTLNSFGLFSTLRNIKEIFINTDGNLVFNKHALVINSYGVIKLEKTTCLQKKQQAKLIGESEFVFPGGLSVINKIGMFILRDVKVSGENNATTESEYQLVLRNAGSNKMELIKILREYLYVSLSDGKTIVDTCSVILSGVSKEKAEYYYKIITGRLSDVKLSIETHNSEQMIFIPAVLDKQLGVATNEHYAGNAFYYISERNKIIDTKEFWKKHILPFIEKIKSYETTN